ncbi:sigma-70 family RNA polymerase sigma factor [Streptomyces phaeochromogenes]|uniref:Sigma-70 family RNA polymerase sigma factor n=1 Tax=Streptomyces phaeochromogenes TaxID=1923 RepID=A0ABZ1HRG0_STRPH|nr:sigma-70 family RNA polymerase sigma factor [Streptomyces phaeochromogenes]WSD21193.1 sigma-70 family RNA polymerase sigma factor [Streptomyces phaeochromogenes]
MDEVDDAAGSVRAVSLHRRPPRAAPSPVRSAQDSASRADFAVFYEQQMPRLVGFVMRHGANVHEAAEAAQAAFSMAFEQWSAIEEPAGWLRTVAWRQWLRGRQRREYPVEYLPELPGGHCPVAAFELSEQQEYVYEALRWLPMKQRQAMAWHLDQFSAEETAKHLNMNPDAVRQNLARARNSLRRALKAQGEGLQ